MQKDWFPYGYLNDVDFKLLYNLSRRHGGFCNRRKEIWPLLLGINRDDTVNYYNLIRQSHRDESQVLCDVYRSLWKYIHPLILQQRRQSLAGIILAVLSNNDTLYYYQGFHDFVSVFLLVFLDDNLTYQVTNAACKYFLKDFMSSNFLSLAKLMSLILNLIEVTDPKLFYFLSQCGMEPFFSTSWILTWFSHDLLNLEHFEDVCRFFRCLTLFTSGIYYLLMCSTDTTL